MNKKIKALLVMQGKEPQLVKIPANLEFIKSIIGKDLERIRFKDGVSIIANRNAKFEEANRMLGDSLILGTFLIINSRKSSRKSLTNLQIIKYSKLFKLGNHAREVDYIKDKFYKKYYIDLIKKNAIA